MPRRRFDYFPPGSTFVDGVRHEWHQASGLYAVHGRGSSVFETLPPDYTTTAADFDWAAARRNVSMLVAQFPELSHVAHPAALVNDILDVIRWAQTSSLEYLTRGSRSKPGEWTLAILFRSMEDVLRKHGLPVRISDYEVTRRQRKRCRSLHLRLATAVAKEAGLLVPTDVKGLALRARKIKMQSFRV